ncbi:MAG: hypothetical protein KF912_02945 [Phycisphaeraceae bacterium]|nr:hypothetical protein [Phycisphaeraceae bacterium]
MRQRSSHARFVVASVIACSGVMASLPGATAASPQPVRVEDPESGASRAKALQNKRRVEIERELSKLRATHFRSVRNVELRQVGISKLRAYTSSEAYPSLLKVFEREGEDVQRAIVEMLIEQGSPDADATLAWAAVMLNNASFRMHARDGLRERIRLDGVTQPILNVLDIALQSESDARASAAAEIANEFEIVGLIPRLIVAQFSGNPSGGGRESDRRGDLAFIAIGRQVAFVSDLTPVVSDSAVGFDPTISVVNEGTVMAIRDASVTIYRTEIHRSLVGLSSRAWGKPTDGLGYDYEAWKRWYFDEFLPSQESNGKADAPTNDPQPEDAGPKKAEPPTPATPGGG